MKREDKIKKLNELGIYEKWYKNVVNDEDSCDPDELLDEDDTWNSFIERSFIWISSPENHDYWKNISEK